MGAVATATAGGPTPTTLTNAGWTCFNDPGAPRIVCSDPGHGRPVPNDLDAPPSYNFKIFALDETFTGTTHLIRADLYNGQPCPQTGGAYFFIAQSGTTGASTSEQKRLTVFAPRASGGCVWALVKKRGVAPRACASGHNVSGSRAHCSAAMEVQ